MEKFAQLASTFPILIRCSDLAVRNASRTAFAFLARTSSSWCAKRSPERPESSNATCSLWPSSAIVIVARPDCIVSSPLIQGQHRRLRWRLQRVAAGNPQDRVHLEPHHILMGEGRRQPGPIGEARKAAKTSEPSPNEPAFTSSYRRAGRWLIGWFKGSMRRIGGEAFFRCPSNVILVLVAVLEQAGGAPAAPRRVVVVSRRLLDGSMPRLLHRLRERNAAIGGFGQIPRPQSVRGEIPRLQPSHRHPLLDDIVGCLRIELTARNIAPAIDRPENRSLVDVGGVEPGVQRLDRPASEIDDLILLGT